MANRRKSPAVDKMEHPFDQLKRKERLERIIGAVIGNPLAVWLLHALGQWHHQKEVVGTEQSAPI